PNRRLRGALAISPPRPRTVDCFSVDIQPSANIKKHLLHRFRYRAIRTRADVHQQIAVFTDDINKLVDDKLWRLECVVLDVAPGLVTYGCVGLPIERADVAELATFDIEDRGALLHGKALVVDHSDMITIFQGAVVIERGNAREIRPDRVLPDPPIEVHDIGMVFLNEFSGPRKPVVGPR